MTQFESINNLSLIENGLLHIGFEMNRPEPSMFRAARESHLVLYRSMIEALKGSANLEVTGRPSKSRIHRYQLGNGLWKEIHKVPVPGCDGAWRFSQPVLCHAPRINCTKLPQPTHDDYLIPFYDALAMIQSECFMHQYVMSREVAVTDDEMKLLEWLHEDIRNEYEHFVPKGYAAPIPSLAKPAMLCLRLSRELLFDSKTVFPSGHYKELAVTIDHMNDTVKAISKDATTHSR
jgi:hypothetical protein